MRLQSSLGTIRWASLESLRSVQCALRQASPLDSTKKTNLGWGVPKNSGSCAAIRVLVLQVSQWRHEVF